MVRCRIQAPVLARFNRALEVQRRDTTAAEAAAGGPNMSQRRCHEPRVPCDSRRRGRGVAAPSGAHPDQCGLSAPVSRRLDIGSDAVRVITELEQPGMKLDELSRGVKLKFQDPQKNNASDFLHNSPKVGARPATPRFEPTRALAARPRLMHRSCAYIDIHRIYPAAAGAATMRHISRDWGRSPPWRSHRRLSSLIWRYTGGPTITVDDHSWVASLSRATLRAASRAAASAPLLAALSKLWAAPGYTVIS